MGYHGIPLIMTLVFEVKLVGYGCTCFSTTLAGMLLTAAPDSADLDFTVMVFRWQVNLLKSMGNT